MAKYYIVFYRCKIPECDDNNVTTNEFSPKWLMNAVPTSTTNGLPEKCLRFVSRRNVTDTECSSPDNFDANSTVECIEFVYKTTEKTILNQVNVLRRRFLPKNRLLKIYNLTQLVSFMYSST